MHLLVTSIYLNFLPFYSIKELYFYWELSYFLHGGRFRWGFKPDDGAIAPFYKLGEYSLCS
jgi:hypothetical protein